MSNLFEAAGMDEGAPRPLADRLRFLWHVARTTLTGDGSGRKQRFEYTTPLLAA